MRIVTVFGFVFLVILLAEMQQHLCRKSSENFPCTDLQVGGKAISDPFMCRKRGRFFMRKMSRIWRNEFPNEELMILTKEIWS